MPIPSPSCAVALHRERNNATEVTHATDNATASAKNAAKPASLQELRAQLRTQLARNQSAERETERHTELRRSESATANDVFIFSAPSDPANDDEALQERVAIMMEGNGWDAATALQEARWRADRERCWRGFLRNAARVQAGPEAEREALLARYRAEAERRYGGRTALDMAQSLASWVRGRGVH